MLSSVFESSEWLSMLSKRSPCPFGGEGSGEGKFQHNWPGSNEC